MPQKNCMASRRNDSDWDPSDVLLPINLAGNGSENWSFPFLSGESLRNVEKEREGVNDWKKGGNWNESWNASKKLLPFDFVVGDDSDGDEESRFKLYLNSHNVDGYDNSLFRTIKLGSNSL